MIIDLDRKKLEEVVRQTTLDPDLVFEESLPDEDHDHGISHDHDHSHISAEEDE